MHETSLIDYALNAVEARAAQMRINQVAEVGLVVGKSKAVPALLEKAFEIIRAKHPMCRSAKLHLDVRDIRMECSVCGTEFGQEDVMGDYRCPQRGSRDTRMISGMNSWSIILFPPDIWS